MRFLSILTLGLTLLASAAPSSVQARESQRLDADWRFTLADVPGAENPAFDDRGWQTVSLPHNWGWEDAQAGKPNHRGPGWYRRALLITPEAGRRYFSAVRSREPGGRRLRERNPPRRTSRRLRRLLLRNHAGPRPRRHQLARGARGQHQGAGHRATGGRFFRLWRLVPARAFDRHRRGEFRPDRPRISRRGVVADQCHNRCRRPGPDGASFQRRRPEGAPDPDRQRAGRGGPGRGAAPIRRSPWRRGTRRPISRG